MIDVKDGRIVFRGEDAPASVNEVLCLVMGCDEPRQAMNLCGKHYQRWHRRKKLAPGGRRGSPPVELSEAELRAFVLAPMIRQKKSDAVLTEKQLALKAMITKAHGAEFANVLAPYQIEQEAARLGLALEAASTMSAEEAEENDDEPDEDE